MGEGRVGSAVGSWVGAVVGIGVGERVGIAVGAGVGAAYHVTTPEDKPVSAESFILLTDLISTVGKYAAQKTCPPFSMLAPFNLKLVENCLFSKLPFLTVGVLIINISSLTPCKTKELESHTER